MSAYVAAYDISSNRRRRQVARALMRWGRPVQESVFLLDLEYLDMPEFKRTVGPLLAARDRFDLFPLDLRDPSRRISWQRVPLGKAIVLEV